MLRDGWVKNYRKKLDWEWFTHPATAHLWEYIVLRANIRAEAERSGLIPAGSFVESYAITARNTGLSYAQTVTAYRNLIRTGEVTVSKFGKSRLITVTKWDDYQATSQYRTQDSTQNFAQDSTQNTTQQNKKRRTKEDKKKENIYALSSDESNEEVVWEYEPGD